MPSTDQHPLSCYAEGRKDRWLAICPELDISVQGASFDDVKQRLEGSIHLYLERVQELPADEQERLLHRRVPIPTVLKMAAKLLVFGALTALLRRSADRRVSYCFPLGAA